MSGVEKLRKIGAMRKYSVNEAICRQGDPGTEMYIILSGRVGVYINSADNAPVKISEIGSGEFFGEMSIFESQPRSATIIALQETLALMINRNNFLGYITEQPEMAFKIMKGLSSRIRHLNAELSSLKTKHGIHEPAAGPAVPAPPGDTNPLNSILFPEGHKTYGKTAPESFEKFIFDKQVTCPVCDHAFTAKATRNSKLRLDRVDYDFRKRYVDFEPLWYSIWVCPECLYSNFATEYEKVPSRSIKALKEKNAQLKSKAAVKVVPPVTIDQVFTAYYLAMNCANICNSGPQKLGKLWLQLSWLYQDVEDDGMFDQAASLALENYHNAFYKSQLNITDEQEQQYYLILGELYLLKGNVKEAQKHFYSAIKRNSGSHLLSRQAQDRLQSAKEKIAAEEKAE